MNNLFRGLLVGLVMGVLLGFILADKRQRQAEPAQTTSFGDDPEVQAIMAESRRLHKAEAWIEELTEGD
jgi:hypothetical protein